MSSLRCVVFDLESVLLSGPSADVALDMLVPAAGARELVDRCFSRYRVGAVSASSRGNVAVRGLLDATDWGRQIEVVVTPAEAKGPAAYRAVCSAMGAQTPSAALVTRRTEAARDATAAGLGVLLVGTADESGAPDIGTRVRTVEHLGWVSEALRSMPVG